MPFGYNGAQAATYNYLITGYKTVTTTTLNATSTITLNGGTTTDLVYVDFPTVGGTLINTGASKNSVSLGKFRITDLGGDGASTTLTSVTISIAKNTNVSEIAIFDSGNNNRGQFASPGASVVFSSLTGISATDSGTDDFEIWATFKNIVTDQDRDLPPRQQRLVTE